MVGHASLLKEFHAPFSDLSPGMIGLENGKSPFNKLKIVEITPGKYLVRQFLRIPQSLKHGELDSAYWPPGVE